MVTAVFSELKSRALGMSILENDIFSISYPLKYALPGETLQVKKSLEATLPLSVISPLEYMPTLASRVTVSRIWKVKGRTV